MHPQQTDFVKSVAHLFPDYFISSFVLDVGSADINGSNRWLFRDPVRYIGVDVAHFPGVDIVCPVHLLPIDPDNLFDVVISTEHLEHDPYYRASLPAMTWHLRPGGLMIVTCASTGRPEHGTARASPNDSLTSSLAEPWNNHYKTFEEKDIREALPNLENTFTRFTFVKGNADMDLYFWGIKRTETEIGLT